MGELTATPLKNGNKKIEARKLAEKAAAMAKAVPQRKFSLQNNFNQPMPMTLAGTRTRRISLMPNMKFGPIVEEIKDVKSSPYALNPNAPCFTMNADGTFQMIPHTNQRRMSNKPVYYASEGPQYMGVPGRRGNAYNNNGQDGAASGLKLPPNVLRMPKGPQESGKGFGSWCRQRMAEPKRVSKAIPLVAPSVNVPGCRWCLTFRSRQLPAPTGLRTRPSSRTSRTLATPATKTAAQNQEKPLTLMTLTTLTREHDRRCWPSPLAISLHSKNIRSLSQTLTRSSCFSSPYPPNPKHMFPLPSKPPYVPSNLASALMLVSQFSKSPSLNSTSS